MAHERVDTETAYSAPQNAAEKITIFKGVFMAEAQRPDNHNPARSVDVYRDIPRPLTDAERLNILDRLVTLDSEIAELEMQKKIATDGFKERIGRSEEETRILSLRAKTGTISERILCRVVYRWKNKKKDVCRKDTGEIVETLPITAAEMQEHMDFGGKAEADEKLNGAKKEK